MRVALLGVMQVDAGSGPVRTGGVKQRGVLAQLCREPNRPVSVDRLAEGIWGEQVPPRYRQNLQVYMSTWRHVLEPAREPGQPSRIVGHREAYELIAGPEDIDIGRYLREAEAGRVALDKGRPEAAAAALGEALAQWRGPALSDLADQPFAADWIVELDQHHLATLQQRLDADLARGQSDRLVPELTGLVRMHPHIERFWAQLALALYRCGRQADALTRITEAKRRLLDELGVDPGPALGELERAVLAQDPSLLATPPVSAASSQLPVPLTRRIGQEHLLDEVVAAVTAGQRLTVLTGPGGIGKTRLALEVANHVAARLPVRWIPLAELADTDDAAARVRAALDDKSLLVLDNLEQLPGIGARLRTLLEGNEGLQLLATSRSPLLVPGEVTVPVPPMHDDDVVALFTERARSADALLDVSSHRDSIVRLGRALDGLPLAIELAGARSRSHNPLELVEQLIDRSDSTVDVAVSEAGRHSSLAAAVEWSVRLLSEPDRQLFAQLSICEGAFDRAVATALGDGSGGASIDALVHVALLRPLETEAGRRFDMLTTVRATARRLRQTTADSDGTALDALAALWLEREREHDPLRQPDAARLAAVAADLPLTRQVLARLVDTHRQDEAATILLTQRRAFAVLGRQDELLSLAIDLLASGLHGEAKARLSIIAGGAAYNCGDPRAPALLAAVADLPAGDGTYRGYAESWLCVLAADEAISDPARHEEARRHGDAAIAAADSPAMQLIAHSAAAWAAQTRGDYAAAVKHSTLQVRLARDDAEAAQALCDLALAQLYAGDAAGAQLSSREAISVAVRLGPSVLMADAQRTLGEALLQAGDAKVAAPLLAAALAGSGGRSDQLWGVEVAAGIALAAGLTGRREEALLLLGQADAVARRTSEGAAALPPYLRDMAHRLGADDLPVLPAPCSADMFDRALALAGHVTSADR